MMFCPNCGKPIPNNPSFCPECGHAVHQLNSTISGDVSGVAQIDTKPKKKPTAAIIACVVIAAILIGVIGLISCEGSGNSVASSSGDVAASTKDPDVGKVVGTWDLSGSSLTGTMKLAYVSDALVIKSDGSLKLILGEDSYSGSISRVENDEYEYAYAVKIKGILWVGIVEDDKLVLMEAEDTDCAMIFVR